MGGSKKSNKSVEALAVKKPIGAKEEKPRHKCLHSQLHKTKFCLYHLKGACQFGTNCSFAHSCAELQATPDLRKTRLCVNFFEGGGCTDANCTFAHSEDDLRSTDMFYKKTLCIWNEKGKCRNGDQCRFAHGLGELRLGQAQEKRDRKAEKEKPEKEVIEKDPFTTHEDMGRQESDTSQVTTASGGSNGSTTGSLSGNDGSTTGTFSTTTRRARARGKRGGVAGQTKLAQVDWSVASGILEAPQPMKVPIRNILPQSGNLLSQSESVPAESVAPTTSALSMLNNGIGPGAYDPLLEVELLQLRASVNALAMQCNHINQQITAEAQMSQAAIRQQLLQRLTQAHPEGTTQAVPWARQGNSGLMNLNALLCPPY